MAKHPDSPPPSYDSVVRDANSEEEPLLRGANRPRRRPSPWRTIFIVVCGAFLTACIILSLGIEIYKQVIPVPDLRPPVKIAVIGAGPAGVACAGAIEKEVRAAQVKGKRRVDITVFERKEKVGGRMVLGGNESSTFFRSWTSGIEDVASGDLLSSSVLQGRMKTLLGAQPTKGSVAKEVGFFDGNGMTAQLTRPMSDISWGRYATLVFKYGASIWRVRKLHNGPMDGVHRFLDLKGIYDDVAGMLQSANLADSVSTSAVQSLKNNGISDKYASDIISPQLERHLSQDIVEISDLALALALNREEQRDCGTGNSKLGDAFQKFLQLSGAKVELSTTILGLKRKTFGFGEDNWILEIEGPIGEVGFEAYDHVVVAAPLNEPFREIMEKDERATDAVSYRQVWVTFVLVNGDWDTAFFGGHNRMQLDQILPIQGENLSRELYRVREISHVRYVYGPDLACPPEAPYINMMRSFYRILSDEPLSHQTVESFFGTSPSIVVHAELVEDAYPLLWPRDGLQGAGRFQVGRRLWWTGQYEAVMSGIDVAWVVGENVGRLVARDVLAERRERT